MSAIFNTALKLFCLGIFAPIIELWYSYNIQGRLTQVKRGSTVITEYIYDTNGQKIGKRMPVAGLDVLYGYNTAGYMIELVNRKNNEVVSRFKYTYDLDGNQKTKNDNFETEYVYDKLGRLVSETEELGNTYLYEFDEFSNRTKLTVTGLDKYTVDYTYDANNRLLKEVKTDKKAVETSEYEYDANGNRVEAYTETIHAKSDVRRIERHSIVVAPKEKGKASIDLRAYNAFGELVQVYRDAMRVHYVYRPDGLRHSKQQVYPFKPDLNQKTTHYWDGQDIVAETNATGVIKATYLRGAGALIAQVIGQDLFYYLHNAHGDVVQRISETGVSAPKYKYDAFGNEKNLVVTDPNPFRYCGEYYDAELQEIYLRARSYDPLSGRFTQEDPAHDGENWYGYANSNPVRFKDPSGLQHVGESRGKTNLPILAGAISKGIKAESNREKKADVAIVDNTNNGKQLSHEEKSGPSIIGPSPATPNYVELPGAILPTNPGNLSIIGIPTAGLANCYGAAIGTNGNVNPSFYSGDDFDVSRISDVDYILSLVRSDMIALNRTFRVLEGPNAPVYPNEYRVALATGPMDYHFMYQVSTGAWAEKPGDYYPSILHLTNENPETLSWDRYVFNNFETITNEGYYDSEIRYFAISI